MFVLFIVIGCKVVYLHLATKLLKFSQILKFYRVFFFILIGFRCLRTAAPGCFVVVVLLFQSFSYSPVPFVVLVPFVL